MRKRLFSFMMSFILCLSAFVIISPTTASAGLTFYENQTFEIVGNGLEYPVLKFNNSADYHNFAPKMVVWRIRICLPAMSSLINAMLAARQVESG